MSQITVDLVGMLVFLGIITAIPIILAIIMIIRPFFLVVVSRGNIVVVTKNFGQRKGDVEYLDEGTYFRPGFFYKRGKELEVIKLLDFYTPAKTVEGIDFDINVSCQIKLVNPFGATRSLSRDLEEGTQDKLVKIIQRKVSNLNLAEVLRKITFTEEDVQPVQIFLSQQGYYLEEITHIGTEILVAVE